MEDKKIDINTIIGYVLIFLIVVWMMYKNQPTKEELEAAKKEEIQKNNATEENNSTNANYVTASNDAIQVNPTDSIAIQKAKLQLGSFAYSALQPSAKKGFTLIENEVLRLKVSNQGGYLEEVMLKKFKTYDSVPLYIIKDGLNASFNINFNTTENRSLNTKDLFFEPTISKVGDNTLLSMKLKVSKDQYLEYQYELIPNEYMIGFSIQSQGLRQIVDSNKQIELNWNLKTIRHAKSASYENRYTEILYGYEGDKDDYLGQSEFTEDSEENVNWIAFKQHFFTSVLLTDAAFEKAAFSSKNIASNSDLEDKEINITKAFSLKVPLELKQGELNYNLNWYYGPTDYDLLKKYDRNLDEIVPLGWGIFGWINKYLFIPFFGFLSSFLPYGFAIILMTIIVRLILSPVTYKSYISQAKMKVIRPEITEINEKYKDNAMKRQQATMALYGKTGVSPMSGCLPALLQIPVFYALFNFFPSAFELRQKSFLWADDLSSYDTIAKLPFSIPFYGDHISLFPILASIAIFIYMSMTTGKSLQTQPGMPNMSFMMYISPIMMLFFFNNYASGLSLYYFISNLITIGIMLVIKHIIIDEDKIHAKIQENKKKPKKQNKFQKKMKEIMEQAEKQQKAKRNS